ncbi:MAG: pro-sigmaK processing inhibitor BofA family protein [Oscillospiraceae bacterium]|jgi:hypothetical protein|nr:pro-sigmaK processing inhibitor BofA family protein [Oscillospiraceae bacterium]
MSRIIKLLRSIVLSFAGLIAADLVCGYIGINLGVNLLNLTAVTILGPAGLGLLLILRLI